MEAVTERRRRVYLPSQNNMTVRKTSDLKVSQAGRFLTRFLKEEQVTETIESDIAIMLNTLRCSIVPEDQRESDDVLIGTLLKAHQPDEAQEASTVQGSGQRIVFGSDDDDDDEGNDKERMTADTEQLPMDQEEDEEEQCDESDETDESDESDESDNMQKQSKKQSSAKRRREPTSSRDDDNSSGKHTKKNSSKKKEKKKQQHSRQSNEATTEKKSKRKHSKKK